MKKNQKIVTKSLFMADQQCPLRFSLRVNKPHLAPEITPQLQAVFDNGKAVEAVARQRKRWVNGIDISRGGKIIGRNAIVPTLKALKQKGDLVLYEACFYSAELNALCVVDVFERKNDQYHLTEIKSGLDLEDTHPYEVTMQTVVVESVLQKPLASCNLLHLNREYVRHGELNLEELFINVDMTETAKIMKPLVIGLIHECNNVMSSEQPKIAPGLHCHNPHQCEFLDICRPLPDYSIFDIRNLQLKRKYELYNHGIIKLEQLPEEWKLSQKQELQVRAYIENRTIIDRTRIKKFLEEIIFECALIDFETVNYSIPINGMSPYSQLVTLYSVHILKSPDAVPLHFDFCATPGKDCRKEFITNLIRDTKTAKTIMAYNATFERTVLLNLAKSFPELSTQIYSIVERLKDLSKPFADLIAFPQTGSWSLKHILPLIENEDSYAKLTIGNGALAASTYASLKNLSKEVVDETLIELRKYVEQDTKSMVTILKYLNEIVES